MIDLTHIAAFLLPLVLFTYWWTLGYALITLSKVTVKDGFQSMLMAPAIGFAFSIVALFILNVCSLPIATISLPLTGILLFLSSVVLAKRPPPLKQTYYPFVGLFLLNLVIIGRPLLHYGFDWTSFSNDDMANYCLAALRFLHHGYFETPSPYALLSARDFSLYTWFIHVPGMTRSGSELTLAWASGLMHLDPQQVFMPVIISLHLMLISITAAMVYPYGERKTAMMAGIMLTFSSLSVLGTLYQLIAQVGGFALIIALVILLLKPPLPAGFKQTLRDGLFISLVLSATLITYPEPIPFLAVSFFIYHLLNLFRGLKIQRSFILKLTIATLSAIVILNVYFIYAINFLLAQTKYGAQTPTADPIFPYFLIPSGMANFWGLLAIGNYGGELRMAIVVLIGLILILTTLYLLFKLILRETVAPACMLITMIMVAVFLFTKKSDFALFKLSMYMQPFLVSTLAIALHHFTRKNKTVLLAVALYILINLPALSFYIARSHAMTPGSYTEIPLSSITKINQEYKNLINVLPPEKIIISNDFNIVVLKLQALHSYRHRLIIPISNISSTYMAQLEHRDTQINRWMDYLIQQGVFKRGWFYHDEAKHLENYYLRQNISTVLFNLLNQEDQVAKFNAISICEPYPSCAQNALLVVSTAKRGVINSRHTAQLPGNFILKNLATEHNYIGFIDSSLGQIYYGNFFKQEHVSMYNYENDYFYSNHFMQAIGRYLLFRIYNPTAQFRLSLSMTSTLNGDKQNLLPKALVIGDQRLSLPIVGRGSARVFSPLIKPQQIQGAQYFMLDMNQEARHSNRQKPFFLKLYGKDVNLDLRRFITFARDISAVSPEMYEAMTPPSLLQYFPADLDNLNLEYSGIYEDGWMAEEGYFVLQPEANSNEFILQGLLPRIDVNVNEVKLSIDFNDHLIHSETITPGNFSIKVPFKNDSHQRIKVSLHFDKVQHLTNGDSRPISAFVKKIGFIKTTK